MKHEFIVNGQVTLVLVPENDMEEHLLKQMVKQDNDVTEIRTAVHILGKSVKNGLIMSSKDNTGPVLKTPVNHEAEEVSSVQA